jgi:hypothetical protein
MKRKTKTGKPLKVISLSYQTDKFYKFLLKRWKADADKHIERCCGPDSFPFKGDGFNVKRKAVKKCLADAKALLHYIEEQYSGWLSVRERSGILKWQGKLIKEKPELKRVFKLFDFIKQHTIRYHKSLKIAEERKISKFRTEKGDLRDFVLFIPDYDFIEFKIYMKRRQVLRYLRALSDTESKILVDFSKMGPTEEKIYGVGYWNFFQDESQNRKRRNRIFFLKNTPTVRKDLMNLDLQKIKVIDF